MSSERAYIVDTVVVLYFLLVDQAALLRRLLGEPLRVPIAVFDPEERSLPPEALRHSEFLSEMRQAVRYYEVAARSDPAAAQQLERLLRLDSMYDLGQLEIVALTDEERTLAAHLQSRRVVAEHAIKAPLGAGEAACVAIAFKRGWIPVTDDSAALTVLAELLGRDYPYERIRRLLLRSIEEGLLSTDEAARIHAEMRQVGFWDRADLLA